MSGGTGVAVRRVTGDDPLVVPLNLGMAAELRARYGASADEEMIRFPAADFDPPDGGFVVLTIAGATVAGGGFRRLDAETAELKRLWTHPEHRGRGLATRALAELETDTRERGYRRLYLVSGPRQPEAHRLYQRAGFRRLPDDPAVTGSLPAARFEKRL
jgi:GNAT superfamily N-acetyltransferase